MLQRIALENFKSFRKAQIDMGQITVLIGPNGTGKSSYLHAMILLRQSSGHSDLRSHGPYLDLGDYHDILHQGGKGYRNRPIKIGIAGTSKLEELLDESSLDKDVPYTYEAEFVEGRLVGHKGKIHLSKHELNYLNRGSEWRVTPSPFVLERVSFGFARQDIVGSPISVSSSSKEANVEESKAALIINYVAKSLNVICNTIESMFFIPAIRGFAAPSYALGTEPVTDFITSKGALDHAQRLASTLAYKRELEEIISKWLKRITGINMRTTLQRNRNVTVETSIGEQPRINIVHEGFGSNQLIFGLAQVANLPAHSIICWEEPEIHLHPRAQSELVNLLVEVAKREDKQILITTHSEHILFPFVSAVRNGTLKKDKLVINYFEERGQEPRRVEQDECGDIYDWGKNFFSAP